MNQPVKQQIVISGVGGQGVLFVTRLLAEAAIAKGLPVFTSETHGMAQRGGTVISFLKIGDFSSPLIRPGQADGILSLKAENMAQHSSYLKADGWAVVNSDMACDKNLCVDADRAAAGIGNPKAVNLVVLGAALAKAPDLFCNLEDIKAVLENRLSRKPEMLASSLKALEAALK